MTIDEYIKIINRLAEEHHLKTTENITRIAKFRERIQLPMDRCPCDQHDAKRGCISKKCLADIKKDGICHCQLFTGEVNNGGTSKTGTRSNY